MAESEIMTAGDARSLWLLGLILGLASSGCLIRSEQRICRIWADYNTLKTPALFIEETAHLPYHAPRVEHYRWMYGRGPGGQATGSTILPAAAARGGGKPPEMLVPAPVESKNRLFSKIPRGIELSPPAFNNRPGLDSLGGKPAPRDGPPPKPLPPPNAAPDGPTAGLPGLIQPAGH